MTETRPVVPGDAPGERDRADTELTGGSAGRDGSLLVRQSVDVAEIEAHDLSASLADLAGLVTGTMGLGELLSRVATYASHAIPGADGAGVTLLRAHGDGHDVEALASSAPFVAEIDELQYRVVNEGPCISAALEGQTVRSGSLGGEKRWPHFGPRVGRLGVHSVLSLPLLLPDRVVGAINVYGHAKDAFDDHAAHVGELFAAPAAVAVHNAQVLAQAMALTTQLQAALSSRPVIDQAIGILRSRSGCSADEAFAKLRILSQHENTRLTTVAQRMVDEAVRRARAHATKL
ncbi:GAF and ANTAR domain-containing protein [Demequina lutea]|uniref:GAF domain-containing protein n=1 Tax=Demequina lutea TaxID=431489 RepID=A0A7Y9ZDW4_9MICO|nr:GAF and ANTAR domain-containing protein [Demequina lutea]NYI42768.1 GAF domain-containing protein [Demequina lutea]